MAIPVDKVIKARFKINRIRKGIKWPNPVETDVCAPNYNPHRNIAIFYDGDWFFDILKNKLPFHRHGVFKGLNNFIVLLDQQTLVLYTEFYDHIGILEVFVNTKGLGWEVKL